ncbi:ABC transporter substrate-binding protein [Luteimonas sp. e5]
MKRIVVACLLLASLLAAACGKSPAPGKKTELTLGSSAADIGTLDPHFASGTADRTLVAWIYGALVRFAPGTINPEKLEPDLAESWSASEDGLVWTFKLRQGVQWHHGFGEVTSDDVVFSLKKSADPDRSAYSIDYAAFHSVDALDPYTVRITLKHPVPSVLGLLSNYSGGFIMSRKAYEELGEDYARRPVGFGPFQFDSVEPGVAVTFVPHKTYFRGEPMLTKVKYRFLSSASARGLAFLAGEVDAATGSADQNWLRHIKATPGATIDIFEPSELNLLHVNTKMPPFDNILVRRALAHALDPSRLPRYRGAEFSRPAKSVVPSDNIGYTDDVPRLEFDPLKAKALLQEAGYPNGLSFSMIASQSPGYYAELQILQANLKESGIVVDLQPVEHATWHQLIRKDVNAVVPYGASRFPIADVYLTQFFHSDSSVGTATAMTNFSHCDVADLQIDAARVEQDPAKRIELWKQAQRLIIESVCAIPSSEGAQVWVRNERLDWGFKLQGSISLGPLVTELTHFKD